MAAHQHGWTDSTATGNIVPEEIVQLSSRDQTRVVVALLTVFGFVLFRVGATSWSTWKKWRTQQRQHSWENVLPEQSMDALRESSFGMTDVLDDEGDTQILATLVDRFGQGHLHVIGRMVWYSHVCHPNAKVSPVLIVKDLLLSWSGTHDMPPKQTESAETSPTQNSIFPHATTLRRIVEALSFCHMEGSCWPAIAVDALLRAVLETSILPSHFKGDLTLEQIRDRLVLMGVVRANGKESFQTINLAFPEDHRLVVNEIDPWKVALIKYLKDMLPREKLALGNGMDPKTSQERAMLYCILPTLLFRLGDKNLAQQALFNPIVAHFRLQQSVCTSSKVPESMISSQRSHEFLLLDGQVLWKRRCCDKITGRDSLELAIAFQDVGTRMLTSRAAKVGRHCLNELLALQTKQFAERLRDVASAMHYLALVLWSCDKAGSGRTKLSPHHKLSRRIFALEKMLEARPFVFADWYEKLRSVCTATKELPNADIQYVHHRLIRAIDELDVVYRNIGRTKVLLKERQDTQFYNS